MLHSIYYSSIPPLPIPKIIKRNAVLDRLRGGEFAIQLSCEWAFFHSSNLKKLSDSSLFTLFISLAEFGKNMWQDTFSRALCVTGILVASF